MTSLSNAKAEQARQAALEQRARLLDAVWDDAQGEQRAVGANALPSRLVPRFPPAHGRQGTYAADLMWCPDGVWRVMRDYVGEHPGSSLLEAPVLAVFLPGLCRVLLGETLGLPSVPVWWLGEADVWPMLATWSRRFWIRDGLNPASVPVALAGLSPERRTWLQAEVQAEPDRFIAGLDHACCSPVQRVSCDKPAAELVTDANPLLRVHIDNRSL